MFITTLADFVLILESTILFDFSVFKQFAPVERVKKIEPIARGMFFVIVPITAIVIIGKDIEISTWVYQVVFVILIVITAIRKSRRRDRRTPVRSQRATNRGTVQVNRRSRQATTRRAHVDPDPNNLDRQAVISPGDLP